MKTLVSVVSLCVVLATVAAIRGVSAQDSTAQPGQPTRARVWIENRGLEESVPVSIHAIEGTALPVEMTGVTAVSIDPASVAPTRMVRQAWEYRDLRVPAGQDAVPALNAAGAEGWEAAGVAIASAGGTVIVMKRPR
jgi:hypothetical protein